MILNADDFKTMPICNIEDKWVCNRPVNYKYDSFVSRLKQAWKVLIKECDAVKFYKQ